jgi:hypothetical protein
VTRLAPIALTLFLATIATPAGAFVDAPRTMVAPEQAQALAAQLENMSGYRFDAVFLDHAPEGPQILADQTFAARQLGPSEALIVVSMGDGQVGAHLGTVLTAKGLDAAAVQALIAQAYAPKAAQGDRVGGVQALAEAMAGYEPGRPPQAEGSAWPLVGALLGLGALAIGAFAVLRLRQKAEQPKPVPLSERIAAIEKARKTGELPEAAVAEAAQPEAEAPAEGETA